MQLIHVLAAGVVGADNGVARIYRRGTSTRATVFSDFEASSSDSSGSDIALDSTGGVVVYVNELVLVQVYSSLGELVRSFVAGEGAYAVEVISPAFTGTDYVSGQRGVSKPTTAGSIFDLWIASAGAIDWEVLFNGGAAPLQDALGSIYGLFYNVKSPEFGAVGDGSTDDTAAWQAAHDAAQAVDGGIIVAPPGVYNISSEISWNAGVHLLAMSGSVTLRQTTAATSHIDIVDIASSSAALTPTYLFGLALDSTVTNSAAQIRVRHGAAAEIVIDSMRLLVSAFCTGEAVAISSSLSLTHIRNCRGEARASTSLIHDTTASLTASGTYISNCEFLTWAASAYASTMVVSLINRLHISDTRFYFQSASGTSIGVYMSSATYPLIVTGCEFRRPSGSDTPYGIQLFAGMLAHVDESNYFSSSSLTRYYQAADTDVADGPLSYLAMGSEITANNSGATSVLPNEYRACFVTSSFATAPSGLQMPNIYYLGQPFDFAIKNNSGGDWSATTPGFTGIGNVGLVMDAGGGPNLVNQEITSLRFVAMRVGAASKWVQVGDWSGRMLATF